MDLNERQSDRDAAWKQAQGAVIGSLLIDPEHVAGIVFDRAKPEQFRDPALRHIFEAARRLWMQRQPVDAVTVLDAAGGTYAGTVEAVMRDTPTAANVETYLGILEENARLAEIQGAAYRILFDCRTAAEASELYEQLGRRLMRTGKVENVSWEDCVLEYLERMDDPTPPTYLSWGLRELDEAMDVLPGDFVILGGEPSAGKTALALQFAYAQAAGGKKVGFFSLESPRERLTDRLMAEIQVAGIDLGRTKRKKISPRDYERAGDAGVRAARVPLRIVRNAYSIAQIRSETILSGFEIIYIDYLQLIDEPGRSRPEIVTAISIQLHRMAAELGVTVIGLSQRTFPEKGSGKKKLSKYDLRESSQLLQDAEIVLVLNVSGPNTRELSIEKIKDGRPSRLGLKFDARHMQFGYLPPPKNNREKPLPDNVNFEELPEDEGGELPF